MVVMREAVIVVMVTTHLHVVLVIMMGHLLRQSGGPQGHLFSDRNIHDWLLYNLHCSEPICRKHLFYFVFCHSANSPLIVIALTSIDAVSCLTFCLR